MNNMTDNKQNATGAENQENNKTFTQDDVNRIVQERLQKERGKVDADREKEFADREAELARKEFRLEARKELSDRGLPEELLDALNMSDKDSFNKSLDIIDKFVKAQTQSTEEQSKLEQQQAQFTMPMVSSNSKGVDKVRIAMGLR